MFGGMGTDTKVYVQPSEVEKFQRVYKGKIYALPDPTDDVSDTFRSANDSYELYDLSGRRISEPSVLPKGVYIRNGRKQVRL